MSRTISEPGALSASSRCTILLALNAVAYGRPFAEYLWRQLSAGVAVNASAVNKELTFCIIAVSLFWIGHIAMIL